MRTITGPDAFAAVEELFPNHGTVRAQECWARATLGPLFQTIYF